MRSPGRLALSPRDGPTGGLAAGARPPAAAGERSWEWLGTRTSVHKVSGVYLPREGDRRNALLLLSQVRVGFQVGETAAGDVSGGRRAQVVRASSGRPVNARDSPTEGVQYPGHGASSLQRSWSSGGALADVGPFPRRPTACQEEGERGDTGGATRAGRPGAPPRTMGAITNRRGAYGSGHPARTPPSYGQTKGETRRDHRSPIWQVWVVAW